MPSYSATETDGYQCVGAEEALVPPVVEAEAMIEVSPPVVGALPGDVRCSSTPLFKAVEFFKFFNKLLSSGAVGSLDALSRNGLPSNCLSSFIVTNVFLTAASGSE